ncbi:MAG: DMT family transporter [Verrucomicrobia bacterium]|nr:DMT family transporter [Verrucomicrobiota bacterium]
MFASFLAAFFFALNATCASHSVRTLGPARANLGRLLVATAVLGTFAHLWGGGFSSASLPWFLLSGIIGMGMGDLGVYGALPYLGSRLTVLMTQCLAAPLAALGEWLWLGTRLTPVQIAWGLLILAGVALAISPSRSSPPRVRIQPIGFLFGFVAACGQGFGALVSRKGVTVAEVAGEAAHNATFGLTAAYQRILAGLVFTAGWFLLMHLLGRLPPRPSMTGAVPPGPGGQTAWRQRAFGWMVANGMAGPVLGVGCYQWALATTPSGIVLPIAATAPLLAIPIAFVLEGDRPTRRALVGGVLAVAGCIALTAGR